MRKGEIAFNKQFLLFSQCFPQLCIFSAFHSYVSLVRQNAVLCGNWLNPLHTEVLIPDTCTSTLIYALIQFFFNFIFRYIRALPSQKPNNDTDNIHFNLTLSQTSPGFYVSAVQVWFLRVCSTLWEKEKLLVTSNFYFSHSVFYPFG